MWKLRIATLIVGPALFLLCVTVGSVSGQTTRGTILGTVSDQTGAVMPGVKITVTQLDTGLSRTVETNADGYYVVPSLLPGKYSIQAEKGGFQTEVIKPIELNVDRRVQVNVTLEVGGVQGTVTVTTEGSLVEATSSSLGQVIREKTIVDLPLNGRNFLQLALLSAGAVPLALSGSDVAGDFRPSLNVSGGRESSNQFTIDGVFNNDVFSEGLNLQLSVDAIQEFKVQRNTFSAEFGQGTAIINVASKSGANNFHGTVFEFLRNDVLDARQFFDAEVPSFRQNQFGFSFGGPIIKDKTFFFTNYEGFRRRRANTFVATLPTASQLSGDFTGANPVRDPLTGQPFPNNIVPQNRISPLSNRIIAFLPKPTAGGASNFRPTRTEKNDFDQFTARVDHRAGTKDHLFVRYSLLDFELFTPGLIELSGTTIRDRPQNVGVQWTHLFSPSVVNEARVGFNRNLLQRLQEGASGENILRFENILDDPINFGLPTINITGFTGFGTSPSVPSLVGGNTYQFNDSLAWVRSSHTLKFGMDFRNLQLPHQPLLFGRGFFNFSGAATGNPVADFLLGHPFVSNGAGRRPSSYQSFHHFSWYAQDDWKVTPHFTLNYGLRYERISVVKERYRGRLGAFDEVTGEVVPGQDIDRLGLALPDNNDFGPRFGFAWQPFRKPHTVVRGGYGIYYDVKPINERNFSLGTELRFQQIIDVNLIQGRPPARVWDQLFPPGEPGASAGLLSDDPRARTPYVQQYSLGIQRELPGDLVIEAAYAGSVGRKLNRRVDINQARLPATPDEPLAARRPYPNFASILMAKDIATSNYNAFQLRVEKRLSHDLYLLATYTFSKSLDTSSSAGDPTSGAAGAPQDRQNLRGEYGLSSFNQRQRFVLSYLYQLPFGRKQKYLDSLGGLANALIGGWRFNGIVVFASGNPFTVQVGGVDRSQTGAFVGGVQRANIIGSAEVNLPASQRTVERFFNTSAFQVAPLGTFGNAGRNIVIGPGTNNFDFSVFKDFAITETKTLQFRTEVFNLFNHPQFLLPVADPTNPAFGRITGVRPAREIQFGLKFIF